MSNGVPSNLKTARQEKLGTSIIHEAGSFQAKSALLEKLGTLLRGRVIRRAEAENDVGMRVPRTSDAESFFDQATLL